MERLSRKTVQALPSQPVQEKIMQKDGMQGHERRHGHRFIMRVPLRFHATKEAALREESVSSMNISTHGVYFATDQKIDEGVLVQLHLKMPKEIEIGRAHV